MKRLLSVLLSLFFAMGIANAQDTKVNIASITASSFQSGEEAEKAIDGNTATIWHSVWVPDDNTFPVTLTITFEEAEHISYVRYVPRQDKPYINGHWEDVVVSYAATPASSEFTKLGTYDLGGLGETYDFTIDKTCGQIRFKILSGNSDQDGKMFAAAAEIEAYHSEEASLLEKMQTEEGVLVRLNNRRSSSTYLTATSSSAAAGAALVSARELSQIWYAHKNGSGISLRNANTSTFLTATYSTLGNETCLYIQNSPNANGYVNISSSDAFRGNTCINLGTDGTTIHEWSYTDDAGSDWKLEQVSDMTIDDVRNHYAGELKENVYYRIINNNYGLYLTDADGYMNCRELKEDLYTQYWTLKKSGSGWAIQNVLTDNYIQPQNVFYNTYPTTEASATMYFSKTSDDWKNAWNINNYASGGYGMHCDGSKNVVPWYRDNLSNIWLLEEVTLTAEEIAAAKAEKKAFEDMVANLSTLQGHLDNLFTDKACTTLKTGIAALSDAALAENADFMALPADIQAMTRKIKNNTWGLKSATATEAVADGGYEKFFRVNEYMAYSHHVNMATEIGQSNPYGKLSNPTGIYLPYGQIAYIYVDQDVPAGATLQMEAVAVFPENCGGARTGQTTDLHKGLNVVTYTEDKMLFIFYEIQNINSKLADFDNLKIHIEGGEVHGTFDTTRGMKNQDWTNMMDLGLIENFGIIHLKSDNIVMLMKREETLQALNAARTSSGTTYTDVELLLHVWNTIIANEEYYQGLDSYADRYRNIWNGFSMEGNYMYATTHGSYFENSTLLTVLNYYSMTHDAGSMWGPSHEYGHNHQTVINCIANKEVSNNLFSNINVWEAGISSTRGRTPKDNFENLANGSFWLDRNIWIRTKMYFQLYLYFHVTGVDTQFYQKLFAALRADRMTNTGERKTVTLEGEQKSALIYKGKDDYLKFAKKCCDVAQMDLSEFFEAYGFFVPVEDYIGDDYGVFTVTTTQSDIDEAKAYMQQYPKKGGNIMFITDYVESHPANSDNKFKAVPAANGMKVAFSSEEPFGTVTTGDYMDYDENSMLKVTNDSYAVANNTITFTGENYLGHKVYDLDGNLIWAVSNPSETIPEPIRHLFPNDVKVVAVRYNMEDLPLIAGDANSDGKIDITDVTAIQNYIHYGLTPGFNENIADANEDGVIDITDITMLINKIHNGANEANTSNIASRRVVIKN